ncbi:uncharacterized protein LOC132796322 [Drosophila nasuta]|uniref:uncharacterized protein LOC132796322 n=1 Tax=Drosophila nasuta TaxID=42062 RepID=UPI00295EDA3F|nr:uncharacterized protein LOC132796322 [Drosophila nasuta]
MPLKAVCIELRPNLCSGHVFLQFEHDLCNSNKTRVVIKENDMHIVEDVDVDEAEAASELVMRHANYGMDIQQISMFTASNQNISFRFNYTQIDLDAVHKAGNLQVEPKPMPLMLSFAERQIAVTLRCSNCHYELVASCCYNKLREFPSGLIDPSEFFCHNHHGNTSNQQQQQPTLVPGPTDLYYGLNHIVLNITVLQRSVINSSDHLYCKRCMRMLGHLILEGAAAKLWADALRWLPSANQEEKQPPPSSSASAVPRELFQHSTVSQLMLRLLSNLWMQSVPQFGGSRALLVASMPDRRQHYMLIQVLERQLAVLRRLPKVPGVAQKQLHYLRACKLYFRVYNSSEAESELLLKQQQQMELPKLSISPYLFAELQARLTRNSQLIPKAWRHNCAQEQLLLTYFFYEREQQEQEEELLREQPSKPLNLKQKHAQKLETDEEYETDAGLDASLDEDEDDNDDDEDEDEEQNDSDDEQSDTDSEPKSTLRHKFAPIMAYEKNLVKRWPTQRQSKSSPCPSPTMPPDPCEEDSGKH